MNRNYIASELLKAAKEMTAIDFYTQTAMDLYLKLHPKSNKSDHKLVKSPSQSKPSGPPKGSPEAEYQKIHGKPKQTPKGPQPPPKGSPEAEWQKTHGTPKEEQKKQDESKKKKKSHDMTASRDAIPMDAWPSSVLDTTRAMGIGLREIKEVREPLRNGQFVVELYGGDNTIAGNDLRRGISKGLDGILGNIQTLLVKG